MRILLYLDRGLSAWSFQNRTIIYYNKVYEKPWLAAFLEIMLDIRSPQKYLEKVSIQFVAIQYLGWWLVLYRNCRLPHLHTSTELIYRLCHYSREWCNDPLTPLPFLNEWFRRQMTFERDWVIHHFVEDKIKELIVLKLSLISCSLWWNWLIPRQLTWLYFNTLRPRQNGGNFADDIFRCIFLNENI